MTGKMSDCGEGAGTHSKGGKSKPPHKSNVMLAFMTGLTGGKKK